MFAHLLALLALPLLAFSQSPDSLSSGAGGTIVSPPFNATYKTCETILLPLNITGIPGNVAAVTLELVGEGRVPPTYGWDGDIFVPVNGTVADNIPYPSEFQTGSAPSGHYYLEVNEWAVNCSTKQPVRYTLQTQVNIVNNGFDESSCPS